MKQLYLLSFLVATFACFAQDSLECNLRRYIDNDYTDKFEIKFYIITHTDTIECKVEKNKVLFPNVKDNFYLELKFDNEIMNLGAYRPSTLGNVKNIVIGKVTKIKKLTKLKNYPDMYMIDEIYPLTISKLKNADQVIYCMLETSELNSENKRVMRNKGFVKYLKNR